MGRIEKTVFISYRRTNLPWALAIYQDLTANGYDVFFDYNSIKSGDFEQIITQNIKGRAHFVLVLTPSALERCNEPGDWLRREIELAIDEKRNIVPLLLEGFSFSTPSLSKYLTGKLELLKKYNGMTVPAEYFAAAMGRLRNDFLNISINAVLHPISITVEKATSAQKSVANKARKVGQKELTAQEWFEKGCKTTNSEKEIHCYTEALRLNPDYGEAYYRRGLTRGFTGDDKGAIADYSEAIRLIPNDGAIFGSRGLSRSASGDFTGAISDFTEAIRLKPKDASIRSHRGLARLAIGDFEGAIADYNEAIRREPANFIDYSNRGLARSALGDFEGAIADFTEAIRNYPYDADYYFNRGVAFSAQGNHIAALSDLQKAREMKPEDGRIRFLLVRVLKALGRKQEATEQETEVRSLIQEELEYNQACGESLGGNVERAIQLLRIGLEKGQATKEWDHRDPDFANIRNDLRFKALVK